MKFVIEPYVGPLPIRFDMTPREVEAVCGVATRASTGWWGGVTEERPEINIGYSASDQLINEVVFLPGAELFFRDQNLFAHDDAIRYLRSFDDSPFEWVGMIVFHQLGIRFSGFHDGDESQKAIGLVRKGVWDKYRASFVPYR